MRRFILRSSRVMISSCKINSKNSRSMSQAVACRFVRGKLLPFNCLSSPVTGREDRCKSTSPLCVFVGLLARSLTKCRWAIEKLAFGSEVSISCRTLALVLLGIAAWAKVTVTGKRGYQGWRVLNSAVSSKRGVSVPAFLRISSRLSEFNRAQSECMSITD